MRRPALLLLLLCTPIVAMQRATTEKRVSSEKPVSIAQSFLPPRTRLADDYSFDFRMGQVRKRWPAVLTGHFVTPNTKDIVFAYYSPDKIVTNHTLFLDLLHETSSGYVKMYELSYRPQVLFGPRGLRLLRLHGIQTEAVAFAHGVGAALGAHLDVLVWRDPWGWRNIFPPNETGYTYFFPQKTGLEIALSTAKHRGLNVTPTPVWYKWNGKRFVKIPPPKGSSKWPLPD